MCAYTHIYMSIYIHTYIHTPLNNFNDDVISNFDHMHKKGREHNITGSQTMGLSWYWLWGKSSAGTIKWKKMLVLKTNDLKCFYAFILRSKISSIYIMSLTKNKWKKKDKKT